MEKSLFTCPICAAPLERGERAYACPNGHAYDKAREGYVHLLPANKKHSKAPGDDKGMAEARRRFLSGGYYGHLLAALCALGAEYAPPGEAVLDSGCGEGYYTAGLWEALGRPAPGGNRPVQAVGAPGRPAGAGGGVRRGLRLPSASGGCLGGAGAQLLLPLALDEFRAGAPPGGPSSSGARRRPSVGAQAGAPTEQPTATRRRIIPYEGFLRAG